MKRKLSAVLVVLLFLSVSCNLSRGPEVVTTVPPTGTPTSEPASYPGCYFNWATQALPELSRQVQEAAEKSGLTGVTARAEAYGENCYDNQTNEIVSFSTMETDFRFTVQVEDLDAARLGKYVEHLLKIVDQLPATAIPGPQPGYIGIAFQAGEKTINMWFLLEDGRAALAQGLSGAALFETLQHK